MSRKWERKVERNRAQANKLRQKMGQARIEEEQAVMIRGRSWLFPLFLLLIVSFFAALMPPEGRSDTLYYITIALYVLLALFYFFGRRPFLKVSKHQLSWRTFTGDKNIPADQITMVFIGKRETVVNLKDGKTSRSFSRFRNLFPMEQVNQTLTEFAESHNIPVIYETKGSKS
jgi:hypothetical protein